MYAVGHVAAVALEDRGLHFVGAFEFLGEFLCRRFVVGIVDGDVGAVGGEFTADFCAETSVVVVRCVVLR